MSCKSKTDDHDIISRQIETDGFSRLQPLFQQIHDHGFLDRGLGWRLLRCGHAIATHSRVRNGGTSTWSLPRVVSDNIREIARLESEALHHRSLTDRISDNITRFAGSSISITLHVVWFILWIILNLGLVGRIHPIDPFPFTFLTLVVSLEAIFLSIFVLISQNRMAHQADRRAHLDLQINLLAEQETTLILRMLERLCEREGIKMEPLSKEIQALFTNTNLHSLVQELNKQLPEEP